MAEQGVSQSGSIRMLESWGAVVAVLLTCGAFILLPRPTAQLVTSPLFLLLFARIRIASIRVPYAAVLAALVGVFVSAAFRYSHVALSQGAFLVSLGGDSQLQKDSKIYRDRLRRIVGARGESLVGIYHGSIGDKTQARVLLDRSRNIGGIIWGGQGWMTASLRGYPPIGFEAFSENSAAREYLSRNRLADLLISRSISSVGLSDGYRTASISFLASVAVLWRDVPKVLTPGHDISDFDTTAVDLAHRQARWTSFSHLALPLWLSGTRHLIRALEGPSVDHGELRCARIRLKQALKKLKAGDFGELEVAVRNNYALALLLAADSSSSGTKLRRAALRHLHAASRGKSLRGQGSAIAVHNLIALKQGAFGTPNEKSMR